MRKGKHKRTQKNRRTKGKPLAKSPQLQNEPGPVSDSRWGVAKTAFSRFGSILGLMGSCLAFYCLLPKVAISPSTMIEQSNPLSTQFDISNDGFLDMINVSFWAGYENIDFGSDHKSIRNGWICNGRLSCKLLKEGEHVTFPIDEVVKLVGYNVNSAELDIAVDYRPTFWPWRMQKIQRFIGVKDESGNFHWNARSLSGSPDWVNHKKPS